MNSGGIFGLGVSKRVEPESTMVSQVERMLPSVIPRVALEMVLKDDDRILCCDHAFNRLRAENDGFLCCEE